MAKVEEILALYEVEQVRRITVFKNNSMCPAELDIDADEAQVMDVCS